MVLNSTTQILPGVQYQVIVSVEAGIGIGLFVNGVLEASDPWAVGTTGNTLPLTLGAICTTCDDSAVPPVSWKDAIDGIVSLKIWDDPLDLGLNGSVVLNWVPPTEYMDCDPSIPSEQQEGCGGPLEPEYPDQFGIYKVTAPNGVIERTQIALLDGEDTSYEVSSLIAGEHCFVATAFAGPTNESNDSNIACKTVQ